MLKKYLPYFKKELSKTAFIKPHVSFPKPSFLKPLAQSHQLGSKMTSPIRNRITTVGHPVGMG